MKTFNTYEELIEVTSNQLTAQQVLNRNVYLKGQGWTTVDISEDLELKLVEDLVELIGGQKETKNQVRYCLLHERPQHWALERMLFSTYNGNTRLSYCAGQDYTNEMRQLRNYLKR